jgi:magnesium chelatase family protein
VDYEKLRSDRLGESSETIRQRVEAARQRPRERFSKIKSLNVIANADMRVGEVRQFCKLDEAGESLIRAAMGQMNLSARGYHRVLKLARTIADLAGSESIEATHLAEALQYRPKVISS